MTPRLSTSHTWTELPADFVGKVQLALTEQFKIEAQHGEFIVDGRIYPQEVQLRIGYLETGRLKQANFEMSFDRPQGSGTTNEDSSSSSTIDRIYKGIEALVCMIDDYFEEGEDEELSLDLPLRWRPFTYDGKTFYAQFSTVNTRLEAEANRILGQDQKQLVHQQGVSDDALSRAEVDNELAFAIQKEIRSGGTKSH